MALQKSVKGNRLSSSRLVLGLSQFLQRSGHLPSGAVQSLQKGTVLFLPGDAISSRMPSPFLCLRPAAPLDIPLQNIVFQQISVFFPQVRQSGLEIAEYIFVGIAPRHSIQGRGDQDEHGLLQNIRHSGGKYGYPISGQHRFYQILVGAIIAGHQTNVPKAVALLSYQAQNAR